MPLLDGAAQRALRSGVRYVYLLLAGSLVACASSEARDPSTTDPSTPFVPGKGDQVTDGAAEAALEPVGTDLQRDILSTKLAIDLSKHTGEATIQIAGAESKAASFEAQGLEIKKVRGADGALRFEVREGRLDVEVPKQDQPVEISVEYGFKTQKKFDGYLANGLSFLWPYFCSNLFPCKSAPAEGVQFSMSLSGIPDGEQAIFPTTIPADAPSYMPALAVGDYAYIELGTTDAGTKVGVWYLSGGKTSAVAGTEHLAGAFDWFEKTYGPYTFGKEVASVAADWGPGAYGGMEHHPFWHIARSAMSDHEVHVHEAAHGWFGNGVRLRCWEDFVLSEGTSTYITARGLTEVGGEAEGKKVWSGYQSQLESAVASGDTEAWPNKGCNTIDILNDPLWSSIPYMKGAFFYKAVAEQVGVQELDKVIAKFYGQHVGKAAGMQDMLDLIQSETGFDPAPLATVWLRELGIPQ